MDYLAINTATAAEILISGKEDYYFSLPEKTMASQSLLPQIDIMLQEANKTLSDMDFFACIIGPGSFTGVRIGISTVRALAYALKKKVLAVTYFDILAYNTTAPTTFVIDGSGGVLYIQNTDGKSGDKKGQPFAIRAEDLNKYAHKNIVRDTMLEKGAKPLKTAIEKAVRQNNFITFNELLPLYLRRSQPEREEGEV